MDLKDIPSIDGALSNLTSYKWLIYQIKAREPS